jgi:CheY-like chemotaxis protein
MAKPARILVLDDEPLIAMMLQDCLVDLGCEAVGPAHTVEAALALLEGGAVDGAILDVSLAAGDSYPVADALQRRSIPFVFATGQATSGIEPRFKSAPILAKPFDFKAVQRAIAAMMAAPPH